MRRSEPIDWPWVGLMVVIFTIVCAFLQWAQGWSAIEGAAVGAVAGFVLGVGADRWGNWLDRRL